MSFISGLFPAFSQHVQAGLRTLKENWHPAGESIRRGASWLWNEAVPAGLDFADNTLHMLSPLLPWGEQAKEAVKGVRTAHSKITDLYNAIYPQSGPPAEAR